MDLFDFAEGKKREIPEDAPLAVRMRPRSIEEFVGQEHFFGPGKLLRRILAADRLSSVIFYGPPGSGKTALAEVIANTTKSAFVEVNATISNSKEIRDILVEARRRRRAGKKTILFIDELHRFNKAQQDILLPDVENGNVILIGATVYNPFFSINSPLISRSQVFQFKPLTEDGIVLLLKRALADRDRGMGRYLVKVKKGALEHLAVMSDGDARRALTALEVGILSSDTSKEIIFDLALAEESIQKKAIEYDATGDGHYDTISAYIKSMRGSDPDAAVYWLSKMLEAGEDPRFIARRLVIFASEDIGNAAPMAIVLANAALQISEFIGMPEAQLTLAQATTYLATCPKSNASCMALSKAMDDVKSGRTLPVPDHLKGAGYGGAEKLGHTGYKYPHSYEGHWVHQDYIPTTKVYYEPGKQGYESKIKERLDKWRKLRRDALSKRESGGSRKKKS